jgi:hypothetical protein
MNNEQQLTYDADMVARCFEFEEDQEALLNVVNWFLNRYPNWSPKFDDAGQLISLIRNEDT